MATLNIKKHSAENIVRPHVTEKATALSESGVYAFEVTKTATKATILKSIKELYKVTPERINIVNIPPKNVITRGKKGIKSGLKKAYVYLKKGDVIDAL